MMNSVVHFEMPYRDAARAAAFYTAAFGWVTQLMGPDMGDYLLVTTAKEDVRPDAPAGAINGGLYPYKSDWPEQYPSVVIGVEDVLAAIERVRVAGGEVLGDPIEIPGVGQYVSFIDSEGNRNSMLQPLMQG